MTAHALHDACLRSFLVELAHTPPHRIALADIARGAGVSLPELRGAFGSINELLSAFFRQTDRQVLAEGGPDDEGFAGEGPRERLFEVLMRRLDALEPHKDAVRTLTRAARHDPALALRLFCLSERSQRWMMAAAGVDCTGLAGQTRARGLALLFARVVQVWLKDETEGLDRTMAALDRELENGARLLGMLDNAITILAPWRACRARRNQRREDRRRRAQARQDQSRQDGTAETPAAAEGYSGA